ncbi:MAG: carbohydrate ABC transporter permease [Armatimonadetes bacterium]|nr:carbohydrate ABC transporter permease [Armatimonadota bacterium]
MAIIPKIGRRTWKMRLVVAGLYVVLSLGALTMVYPFLLMLGTSITSGADVNDFAIVPRYLFDDRALFPKYVEDRYAGDIELVNQYYGTDFARIESVVPPNIESQAAAKDWDEFVQTLPIKYKQAGFEGYANSPSKLRDAYHRFIRSRFKGDIHRLDRVYGEEEEAFETVAPPFERFKMREWEPDDSPKMRDWMAFKARLPAYFLRPILMDPTFQGFLRNSVYDGSIDRLNQSWGTSYKSFNEIHLAPTPPSQVEMRKDWEAFVRHQLPFRYMSVDKKAASAYGISPKERLPVQHVSAINVENLYREHLAKKFGTVESVNQAFGTRYGSLAEVVPPAYQADWHFCVSHAGTLRKDFLLRNYATVIDFILLHGRAVLNTFIFVAAVILIHLIVNPMCAYALSRYNLPYAYKVLLFLLATMAFPAEVAMIPSFLLLKQFHLLNTYWALILPGMANGYAIFLLKGFFDSLPKELYEAGIMDGASEATMFRKITIPMSKPIFAVIALQSFTGAYSAFMYAMLVCQDPKMWTMMVWLYQLQTTAPQYITMAALTLAAVPTLLVFVFAQNVIMRGIIIPSYK